MRRGDDLHGRYSMMQQDFICPTGDSGGDDLARGLNCPLPRPKQRTRTNRGSQLLEPGDGPQVEAYEYDATLDLVAMDHFDDCSGEFSITLLVSERFQFDVHDKISFRLICQEREHIVERGYGLPRVLRAREPAIRLIEPTTDVDPLKLAPQRGAGVSKAQLPQFLADISGLQARLDHKLQIYGLCGDCRKS